MIARQFILPIAHELIVDLFAGGGGASCGIEQALRRHVDIAGDRDATAEAMIVVHSGWVKLLPNSGQGPTEFLPANHELTDATAHLGEAP